MSSPHEQLESLHEIKTMMERSSRFISLSGLSGILAGTFALLGAGAAYARFGYRDYSEVFSTALHDPETQNSVLTFLFLDATLVLLASLFVIYMLTARRAKKNQEEIMDDSARRLLLNLLIPLVTGGLLCIILFMKADISLIAPCTLIFYGLALVNGSKYSLNDIRYLGLFQIVLGLLNAWFIGYGLIFWSLGFGVLHIIYGALMWHKYERN